MHSSNNLKTQPVQVVSNSLADNLTNYLFWVLFILFTNPGGVVNALNIYYITAKINISDLIFILLSICYYIIPKAHTVYDTEFFKIKKYLLIFLIYYLVVFVVIVPMFNANIGYSLQENLIKSRYTLYVIFVTIYIYDFFKRSSDIFIKVFLFSSIFILTLFIITVLTNTNILPRSLVNRGFVNINRNLMYSEGLMPILVPLGVVTIVFKLKIKHKKLILIGFALMLITYLLELWRRNIIAVLIFIFLAVLLDALITKQIKRLVNNSIKIIITFILLITIMFFLFPRYLNAAYIGIEQSFSVIENKSDTSGNHDVRMTLNRPFINNIFYKHPFFGTGFDNRWRTKSGDTAGYEAADYPFLSALAMFGVVGLLFFFPLYYKIFKSLKSDFEYLRLNYYTIDRTILFLILVCFILYFSFDLLQYFNYFQAASNSDFYYYWYFYLAFYAAARAEFYSHQSKDSTIESDNLPVLSPI